jgi:hypothetical protein
MMLPDISAYILPTLLFVGMSAPPEQSVFDQPPDTLISTAAGTIGGITDLLVAPNGSIYLADQLANGVHVVGSDGRFVRTIGREGQGPGEFRRPGSLVVWRDTLGVLDRGNNRLQLLSLDGEPLVTHAIGGPNPGAAFTRVGPAWLTLRPTLGAQFPGMGITSGELLLAATIDGTVRARIGRAEGVSPNPLRISEERRLIAEGGIPTIFLNNAAAWANADGDLWMMIPARATVARFDPAGRPLWSVAVEDPAFEEVYERFVAANAEAGPNAMPPLRYLLDAELIGDELWVLLGQSMDGAAVIRILRANGSSGSQMTFSAVTGAGLFAVDTARRLVYFVRPETADLLRSRY